MGIRWVFFDLGSTRLDESRAVHQRIMETVPAKVLGMKTVWIRLGDWKYASPRSPEETPDFVVEDWEELDEILRRL